MDNVVIARAEEVENRASLQPGLPRLLCQNRRKPPVAAAQFVARYARMFRKRDRRIAGMPQVIGVGAVYDFNIMSAVRQRMREPVNLHAVAAEGVWRIKRREV